MSGGGHRDADRFHPWPQLLGIRISGHPVSLRDQVRPGRIDIRNADQFRAGKSGVEASMVLPQMPDPNHANAQSSHRLRYPLTVNRHTWDENEGHGVPPLFVPRITVHV
jgi:hypothetical protein